MDKELNHFVKCDRMAIIKLNLKKKKRKNMKKTSQEFIADNMIHHSNRDFYLCFYLTRWLKVLQRQNVLYCSFEFLLLGLCCTMF